MLPPGAVTALADRTRAALKGLHSRMAPAPVRILEGIFGALDHRVLVALCAAEVPDALTRRMQPEDLAEQLGVDHARLDRLLRFAATRGWVHIDRRGRVRPNAVTAFLRRDHPGGWRAWVEFAGGDEIVAAIASLTAAAIPSDPFAAANGRPFFDWMSRHPERWAAFDDAMAAGARMHALVLDAALDWSGTRRVCDVGGGTGHLLASLLEMRPHLTGAVFDLPDVVARAVHHERLAAIGGDFFGKIPQGFDTYLLVNVLHDWSDADATRILGRVAIAAAPARRIVVVENERTATPRNSLAVNTDVLMAALTNGGRERSTSELAALGRMHGLRLARTVRLASGDLAHELVTTPAASSR